ncbi:MAG: isochorismate synthase MenF [Haloarculaceae archaeon]
MEPVRGDEQSADAPDAQLVTRGRTVEAISPQAVLERLERPTVGWSEDGQSVVAGGAAATVEASGAGRFEAVKRRAAALFADRIVPTTVPRAARPRLFGGFAFHESSERDHDELWTGFPDAMFVLPAIQVVDAGEETWLVANATGADPDGTARRRLDEWEATLEDVRTTRPETEGKPGVASRTFTPDEAGWRDQVTAAVDRIERGDLRKVVLAQSQTVDLERPLSVSSTYGRLGDTYPDCYRFLFAPDDGGTFLGATPETLVSRDGRTIETQALAGSTGRGDTPAEDEWLARELQESEKDVHEHRLVVEAIERQLDPYATTISTGERTVRTLDTVQHLETPVSAALAEDYHVLTLVEALHPTPAVGGLPPDAAWETIREAEKFDRGWYASPVGWFDAEGDGTFAVAIRSALARGDRATLFAGNGIVADSDPDREWDEVQLKYRFILDALE